MTAKTSSEERRLIERLKRTAAAVKKIRAALSSFASQEEERARFDDAALRARAVEAYGPNTRVAVATDARLGAGLVVRAGHTQFDGSLKGRLRRLRHAFAQ